jgi:drug/metabolite transporter (DMT)-like permease
LRSSVVAAYLAVCIVWGSTYLAIRFTVETIPPFFMAGTRFIISGLILYAIMRLRGNQKPTTNQWTKAAIIGGLMLMGGNGVVVWAEQYLPSGLTSIFVAAIPLWVAIISWLTTRRKPNLPIIIGLIAGFTGIGLLVGDIGTLGSGQIAFFAGIALVFGPILWASGSFYSSRVHISSSSLLGTAMEMITGGVILSTASLVTGEFTRIRLAEVSFRSSMSWLYLIVFGSLIGYTCYMWLLKNADPERASTYAFVNPVVALFLGWTLASETLSAQNLIAVVIILASVAATTTFGRVHESPKITATNNQEAQTPKGKFS